MSKLSHVAEATRPAWVEISAIFIRFFHSMTASLPMPMPTKDLQIVLGGLLGRLYLFSPPQKTLTGRSVHILKTDFLYFLWRGFHGIQTVGLRARHTADHFLKAPAPVPVPVAPASLVVQNHALGLGQSNSPPLVRRVTKTGLNNNALNQL
ncbi:hypothetical protein L798_11024 [Zootermopsis nevadensis]|uniref:Uncharacterized protein n=1 Tax=Zootermopsis nevadensis TaxID=136037 RepID=A0A067RLC4_ZOONE|nr:hypothetical protein L798_11024 [Zootermopsis nevadensis]